MSLVGQYYSDSESDDENDEDKIPISKVNEKPYGLIITEETTEIIDKDNGVFNIENSENDSGGNNNNNNSNNNDNNSNNKDKNEIQKYQKDNEDDSEIKYQIADNENDKMNHCHRIIHTKLENRDIDIPKENYEPKTPILTSPAFVSTPPHSKDPNFRDLYPHNITSPQINNNEEDEDDNEKQQQEEEKQEKEEKEGYKKNLVSDIIKNKRMKIDMSFLPEQPKNGKVDPALEEKILRYHKMRNEGISINQSLRDSHSFRNPLILEKLIAFCEISELGSNYKKSEFDPNGFKPDEFYEQLNENQRKMDEKREYERLNRNKIDFVSSSSTPSQSTTATENDQIKQDDQNKQQKPKKKYNKWEKEKYKQKQQQLQQQQQKAKATVISAAPSIIKKRENPNTQTSTQPNTQTNTAKSTSESLLKRFKTNGF